MQLTTDKSWQSDYRLEICELVRHFPCLAMYSGTFFVHNTRNIDYKGHNKYKGKLKIDKRKCEDNDD